ncbi:MAG TPA: carboxypeptidase regulatory-like domain-containing protein [Candidatus Acidoferrales bacterium]|nr:carboxypeptidase regulatory-like domain-containing protein [Candidatus Acidoferrales bacterium]
MFKSKGWGCVYAVLVFSGSLYAMPQNSASPRAIHATESRVSALVAPIAKAKSTDESSTSKLPIRRVVLYKTGVGYFEHLGHIQGDQDVRIDFTSGQLNDVLQSLTILDLNGGRIAGVSYNSEAPLSQRLGALRLPLEETTDASKFYGALRGARLEVRSGTSVATGRLLSVERKTRVSGGTTLEVDVITLVSDTGDVRSVELTPSVSVRLAEHDVNDEVGRYLGLLGSAREQDLRRMTIETAGAGDRQLYVSYISEVPVWKTTYRIVLPSKGGEDTLLQGWAIVDNTVGEDWSNVELSLVAGAPQSFIQPLSQPLYTRRPVIALAETAQLTPQTHEAAMLGGLGGLSGVVTDPSGGVMPFVEVKLYGQDGTLLATATTDNQGRYAIPDLPAGNYRAEFSAQGFNKAVVQGLSLGGGRDFTQNTTLQVGSTSETVTVTAAAESVNTAASEVSSSTASRNVGSGRALGFGRGVGHGSGAGVGPGEGWSTGGGYPNAGGGMPNAAQLNAARGGAEAVAQGADLGDLFEYKLKDRVTIRKNESALVPIVQAHVTGEKVSLWNSGLNSPRPLRALWLTNSSGLTLDSGSFSILENEAFAGEGLTDAIKPGEKRLLSYAADLGVRVESRSEGDPQRVTHVRVDRGVMTQTCELRQQTVYTVRNDDTTPRTVLIEHPLRTGWLLAGDNAKPDETTSAVYRFRVKVDPKDSTIFAVRESRPLESTYQLTNLTDDQIKLFLQQKSISPEIEAAFRKIVEQKNRVAAVDAEISSRDDETQKIYDDQQRLRENLKALKGTAEERALTQRYTQQLADQETRLRALQRESADLQEKRDKAQAELDQMIQTLSLDATI